MCLIPELAIAEAAKAGVPLVHALVLLDMESSGGQNIFGEPKQPCGQPRWSTVTEQSYREYRARRDECGSQGVGPMQLTWPATQDTADAQGGCWDVRVNIRVGLTQFAEHLQRGDSARDAYSLYNTGKPGDTPYARKALSLLPHWQRIVDG